MGDTLDRSLEDLPAEDDGAGAGDSPASPPPAGEARPKRRGPKRAGRPRKARKLELDAPLAGVGVAGVTLNERRYHPQPGATVLNAGAAAEAARGGDSDLVIVAVEAGRGPELAGALRDLLGP